MCLILSNKIIMNTTSRIGNSTSGSGYGGAGGIPEGVADIGKSGYIVSAGGIDKWNWSGKGRLGDEQTLSVLRYCHE